MSTVQDHIPSEGEDSQEVLFEALLTPNRSLGPRGFLIFMGMICCVSFTLGLLFYLQGAWFIPLFLGADVALVYLLFRANYRHGRRHEILELTPNRLTVRKVNHYGREQVVTFQPYWLSVSIDDPVEHHSQIMLASHGKRVVIGSFLAPEERGEVAEALRAALERARQAPLQLA